MGGAVFASPSWEVGAKDRHPDAVANRLSCLVLLLPRLRCRRPSVGTGAGAIGSTRIEGAGCVNGLGMDEGSYEPSHHEK
jgi:hypothetical protein